MPQVSIILFIIAAILGLIILTAVLKDRATPKPIVFIHGPIAAIALIIAIVYLFTGHADPLLIASVILFVIAALGGLTLFTIDMRDRPIPKFLAVLHPIFAATGLVLLIIYALK